MHFRAFRSLEPALRAFSGFIGQTQFAEACRSVGFAGPIMDIFAEVDTDGSGIISLAELAPDAAKLLNDLKALLKEKYGSVLRGHA